MGDAPLFFAISSFHHNAERVVTAQALKRLARLCPFITGSFPQRIEASLNHLNLVEIPYRTASNPQPESTPAFIPSARLGIGHFELYGED